uniref:Uncharacterized protein n=1 Tax=Panagrolaimus davidi TaxID=227884 RepID=A0A914QP32_9BILA
MKKNYEKNLSLLKKFEKACDDDTEWLKCLKQLENEESVIANIELRLGSKKSCTNKDIWKHYIEYLRDRNPVAMLEVYLRYCRFFISDKQMLKNYRIEIERVEKLQAVSIFWVDTIEWELEFGDLKTAHTLLSKITGNESVIPELTTKENFANVLNKYKIKKSIKQKFIPKKLLCEENSDFIMKLSAHFGIPSKFLRIEKPEPFKSGNVKYFQCRALRVLDEKNRTISYNQIQAFIESFGNKLENIKNHPTPTYDVFHALLFTFTSEQNPSTLLPMLKDTGFDIAIFSTTRLKPAIDKHLDSTNLNASEIE